MRRKEWREPSSCSKKPCCQPEPASESTQSAHPEEVGGGVRRRRRRRRRAGGDGGRGPAGLRQQRERRLLEQPAALVGDAGRAAHVHHLVVRGRVVHRRGVRRLVEHLKESAVPHVRGGRRRRVAHVQRVVPEGTERLGQIERRRVACHADDAAPRRRRQLEDGAALGEAVVGADGLGRTRRRLEEHPARQVPAAGAPRDPCDVLTRRQRTASRPRRPPRRRGRGRRRRRRSRRTRADRRDPAMYCTSSRSAHEERLPASGCAGGGGGAHAEHDSSTASAEAHLAAHLPKRAAERTPPPPT